MAESFSLALTTELKQNQGALPVNFNIQRFVQNSVALLNNNETLGKFARQHGTAQIKAGLMRAAYQNLDAMNGEVFLIPYGSALTYMPSYKGMTKMVRRYSSRRVQDIYSKVVRDGDSFEETIINGQPTINYTAKPFNDGEILGVFAVCLFADGGLVYEVMSKAEVEQCRKSSKSKNSPAWSQYWGEMARKTVIRRLCKSITIDMDSDALAMFNAGTEIETNPVEVAKKSINENANAEELFIEGEVNEDQSEEVIAKLDSADGDQGSSEPFYDENLGMFAVESGE